MRNKFAELVAAGVTYRENKPVAPETPTLDPIVLMYNRWWGAATDTHCSLVDGRYIVTGHYIEPAPTDTKLNNKYTNTLFYSATPNGVDVRPSGYCNLVDMLCSLNKEVIVTKYNNDWVLEFVDREPYNYDKETGPCAGCMCSSDIPVPIKNFESVPGTFKEMFNRCENLEQLSEALTATPWVYGDWKSNHNQLVGIINEQTYIIEADAKSI